MKKIILIVLTIAFVAFSCEEKRDAQLEYEQLRDIWYSSPREGESAAQEYIDYFHNKNAPRINDVYEIRSQYRKMDDFFSKSFENYATFMSESRELNAELSRSNYSGVRQLWKNLYEEEQNRLIESVLDNITASNFDSFFRSEIRKICENEFYTWEIESIDQVSLSTPTPINGKIGKEASGQYRIHLRGAVLGLRTSEAILSIEGAIGISDTGSFNYIRTGYHFLEKPIG